MRDFYLSDRVGALARRAILVLLLILPLSFSTQAETHGSGIQVENPGSDLWRAVRQRDEAAAVFSSTQVQGVDSQILINSNGEKWRNFRMNQLIPYSAYLLLGAVLLLILFYLVRGRVTVVAGMGSGKLFRYSQYERLLHWGIASIFLFLAFTGLILLFGRSILIPIVGHDFFALLASASKEGHNLFGPLFFVMLALVFVRFVRRNIYQKGDLTWLLKGGGLVGKGHVPSNFFNMGEKSMFWMLVLVGLVITVSGLVLLFPVFTQDRVLMELSHVAHGISVVLMMAVILGHMYIGSVGMEGALEGMTSGYCDLNWAREHHEQWAEECEKRGEVLTQEEVSRLQGDSGEDRQARA